MITFFNKKMLFSTRNTEQYRNVLDMLVAEDIDFKVEAKGANTRHTIARTGDSYSNMGMLYFVYVHEKDYDKAVVAINKK